MHPVSAAVAALRVAVTTTGTTICCWRGRVCWRCYCRGLVVVVPQFIIHDPLTTSPIV